jgi:flagellar hook-associated protein 1 FlgK
MGTISSAFSVISQALDADQSALSIVSNNVANANTTGYTREVANFEENAPITINGVAYGSGVTQTGATSVRDKVLEERLVQQQQLASASGTRLTALDTMQALFTPASGSSTSTSADIGTDITSFFSAVTALEASPADQTTRQAVLSTASALSVDISSAATSLNQQKSALDQDAASVTSQVNTLTSAIAGLNLEIQSSTATTGAATLEDTREQDISQLSQLVGINQITSDNGSLSITTTSGQALVMEGNSYQLTNGTVNGCTHFFVGSTDVTSELTTGGGELGGYLTARDTDIPNVLSSLDQLAYSISTNVNTVNNNGTDLAGDNLNAGDIFSEPTQVAGSAASMSVTMTDPDHIAAAKLGAGTGNNANATAMADLANQKIVSGQTPVGFYASFVAELGSTVAGVQAESTAQNASVTQLQTQASALSSVNLNDEAASMQQFERSYQAAAQVFTMLNQIMASALNLGQATAVS